MSFDPVIRADFGETGLETTKKMVEALSNHSLGVSFDPSSKTFTILGSSTFKTEEIEQIFKENVYSTWEPSVLDKIDQDGNHLVKLKNTYIRPNEPKATRVPPIEGGDKKDHVAAQLVSNLESFGVVFAGKTCLDIGCRSGENSFAMQRAGANVIGIDPDNSSFEIAIAKGMNESQLVQTSLQEYHPENKFDIATVFLWNISHEENVSFIRALQEIIKPDGMVIIGWHDEAYERASDIHVNVNSLMIQAFQKVEKAVFPTSLNKYILKCSNPRI